MNSPNEAAADARARRLLARGIAKLVLPEAGVGIERRDGLVLMRHGILTMDPQGPDRPSATELVSSSADTAQHGTGPLVFYRQSDGGNAVVSVRNLLMDERADVRVAGVRHLQRVLERGLCGTKTGQALAAAATTIDRADPRAWIGPAVELVDAIDADWGMQVAGVRQASDPELQELWSEHLTRALRPTPGAVNECSVPVLVPTLHTDRVTELCDRWAKDPPGHCELARRYCDALGHVPLGQSRSLGRLLAAQADDAARMGIAESIEEAGRNSPGPIGRYHACEAWLTADAGKGQLPAACCEWFWETVLPAPKSGVGTPGQEHWRLVGLLARYFIHFMETCAPTDHGEALCTMAWWMARQLDDALVGGPEAVRSYGDQIAANAGVNAEGLWELVWPVMSPSVLRSITLHGPSPWSLALASCVSSKAQAETLLRGPGPGNASERTAALVELAVLGAPVRPDPATCIYRFGDDFRAGIRWFCDAETAHQHVEALRGVTDPDDTTATCEPAEILSEIESKDAHAQQWLCHVLRARASAGTLSADAVWKAMSTDARRAAILDGISPSAAHALALALIELAAREPVDWRAQLPHLLAEAAERRSENKADREQLFACTARACFALRMGSAVTRLLRGPKGHRFRSHATLLRGNLERVLPSTTGWVAGRLRSSLEDLSV